MAIRFSRAVAGRGVTLIRRVFEGAPAGCINLGLGQPTDPLPDSVRAALRSSLEVSGAMPYTETAGLPTLRSAIAQRVLGGADPARVLVTAGSQEALWIVLMGLVDAGDDVLFAEPGYPAYRMVTEMIGARPVAVPVTFEERWRLTPAAVEAAWTERTRVVIVASPANPTGMSAGSDAELARIHALCVERDAFLVADEIYAPLSYREGHAPMHGLGERVIAIHGVSKAFAATGLRIGWLAADPEIVRGLLPLHQQVVLAAPTLSQRGALACLELWGEPFFGELRERYLARRTACVEALGAIPGIRFHEPDGAFYVLVDVSSVTRDTLALALRLRDEHHVITAPGEAFGPGSGGLLRLSFATDPEKIREGVGRLGTLLAAG